MIEAELKIMLEEKLRGEVRFDEPMAGHTTFRIGGPVDALLMPTDLDDLKVLLQLLGQWKIPYFILGKGSNLLVADRGIRGVAIAMSDNLCAITLAGHTLKVEAGASLERTLAFAEQQGLGGLEFLAGIPGSVGGAVSINAGAFGKSISDILHSAVIMGPGSRREVNSQTLNLQYRHSEIPEGWLVAMAQFQTEPCDHEVIRQQIRQFRKVRRERHPIAACAGSIFKNPSHTPAGKLIDRAGCKGMMAGDAEVSLKHGNFIINRGKATAAQVLELIERVREQVAKKVGVELELEIRLVGEFK